MVHVSMQQRRGGGWVCLTRESVRGCSATSSSANRCINAASDVSPARVNSDVATLRAPELLEPLAERPDAGLCFRVASRNRRSISPIRRIRSPCCARAASGHAAAPPRRVMKKRAASSIPRCRLNLGNCHLLTWASPGIKKYEQQNCEDRDQSKTS